MSRFTLAKAASAEDTTLYVEENPENAPIFEGLRILRFMGELIQYESFTTDPPYCFIGCKRGFNGTYPRAQELGTIGGVLDVSEFCANSAYIDQRTSLQDEIADQIAEIYDAGFEFMYFDGSEGTNPPFDINVGLAQWRVYKKLNKKPIFCEGAAKSHFSWHMLSGGNAFDVWEPQEFKQMIVQHPFAEAPRMGNDFTRINFGWWSYHEEQRPDIFEYGTAIAAACDCPGAFQAPLQMLRSHPRSADILETIRRWELARATGFVTQEVKTELKKTDIEHTLLVNDKGELELAAWEQIDCPEPVTAFAFTRKSKNYVVCWHNQGSGVLKLSGMEPGVSYISDLGGEEIRAEWDGNCMKITVAGKRYLITSLPMAKLKEVFANSQLEDVLTK